MMDLFKFRISARGMGVAVAAACLSTGILAARAETVPWTEEDTEQYWADIAEKSTRTSTSPRFAEADEAEGEGVLEAFGAQYLPNAYAHYQEVRATAKEREQVLKENFPDGRSSDATGGALYDKVQKACAKSVVEMFRRHDELCHFLLLHRMGAMTDRDLTDLDSSRIAVVLPEEAAPSVAYARSAPALAAAECDFATKYLPESWAAFQRLEGAFSEGVRNYAEWRKTALLIDATRSDALFLSLRNRLDGILEQMDGIVRLVKEKKLLHAVGETTAAKLAEEDRSRGLAVQAFEKKLPVGPVVLAAVRSVSDQLKAPRLAMKRAEIERREREEAARIARERAEIERREREEAARIARERAEIERRRRKEALVPTIIQNMVPIPGKNYRMGKCEVTQCQWEAVMGDNPSDFKGENNPVENVSWWDCQEFLGKLNALPSVQTSGLVFRLPTAEEWEFACRAGATGDYCKLVNGTEITKDTLGQVAWFGDNSDEKTHLVGQKQPNAFGLYDMHGNVHEWTSTMVVGMGSYVCCGGSWYGPAGLCESSHQFGNKPSYRGSDFGFRLCASDRAD